MLRADSSYVDGYCCDDRFGWGTHTSPALAVRVLPGDHFFLQASRAERLSSPATDLAAGPAPAARIAVPMLEPGEVHVWHAHTDEPALCDHALLTSLSGDEQDRAGGFRFPRDGSRFVRRRWLLRLLLVAYGADPGATPLPTGLNGKPSVAQGPSPQFSTSSSGGLAVVALARDHEIGIDVERRRAVADRDLLVESTMTPSEQAELSTIPEEQRDVAFLRLWTVKEAFIKKLGTGLSLEPAQIDTRRVHSEQWSVSSTEAGPACAGLAVDVGPGHVASLVVPGAG